MEAVDRTRGQLQKGKEKKKYVEQVIDNATTYAMTQGLSCKPNLLAILASTQDHTWSYTKQFHSLAIILDWEKKTKTQRYNGNSNWTWIQSTRPTEKQSI